MLQERLSLLEQAGIIPNNALTVDQQTYANPKSIINLTLNQDEVNFQEIVNLLRTYSVLFQNVSIFFYRILTMDHLDLKMRLEAFAGVEELDFIRQNPQILAETTTVEQLLENIESAKEKKVNYHFVDEDGFISFDFTGGVQ